MAIPRLISAALATIFSLILSACGGGGAGGTPATSTVTSTQPATTPDNPQAGSTLTASCVPRTPGSVNEIGLPYASVCDDVSPMTVEERARIDNEVNSVVASLPAGGAITGTMVREYAKAVMALYELRNNQLPNTRAELEAFVYSIDRVKARCDMVKAVASGASSVYFEKVYSAVHASALAREREQISVKLTGSTVFNRCDGSHEVLPIQEKVCPTVYAFINGVANTSPDLPASAFMRVQGRVIRDSAVAKTYTVGDRQVTLEAIQRKCFLPPFFYQSFDGETDKANVRQSLSVLDGESVEPNDSFARAVHDALRPYYLSGRRIVVLGHSAGSMQALRVEALAIGNSAMEVYTLHIAPPHSINPRSIINHRTRRVDSGSIRCDGYILAQNDRVSFGIAGFGVGLLSNTGIQMHNGSFANWTSNDDLFNHSALNYLIDSPVFMPSKGTGPLNPLDVIAGQMWAFSLGAQLRLDSPADYSRLSGVYCNI